MAEAPNIPGVRQDHHIKMNASIGRVLVSGGAGFIGSHIVDKLVEGGYEVGILDNLFTGDLANISQHDHKIKVHKGDISDYNIVKETVNGYDAVIHEAALVSVTRSVEDPIRSNLVNVGGTLNLLKASVDSGVKKFLYASSSSVYGETETLPKKESMNTLPISPYAVSKLAAENYCRAFAKVYGLNTISLRYFNVYGPRQKYGQYSGVIPMFVKKAMNNEPPLIYGDGSQTRDFTFVGDVAQANLLCLENSSISPGEVFNAAAGNTITINDLALTICELLGKPDLKAEYSQARKGDIKASYADITKIRKIGFTPKFTLRDGLERVIEWFKSKK